MDRSDQAASLFREGYNCAQAVLLAFADVLSIDKKTAAMLSSSFGGGMGRLREVCGAVSSMFLIAGLVKGYDRPDDDEAKAAHYQLIQTLAYKFKEENGSIICRELLGLAEGADFFMPAKKDGKLLRRPSL
ncbi:C-GCAxxG-C-C family protein [Emergencia timonensis]|uniref:C-GCAxxG-C-C family protein n=1 Tax=Emergencia timonensis TaxID=1776384 RepID=UPI002F3FA749